MQNKRKAASPMEAIQSALDVMIEACYDDSEATPAELSFAHQKFENAINYLAARIASDKFDELWQDNQSLRERLTRMEGTVSHLRSIISRLEEKHEKVQVQPNAPTLNNA